MRVKIKFEKDANDALITRDLSPAEVGALCSALDLSIICGNQWDSAYREHKAVIMDRAVVISLLQSDSKEIPEFDLRRMAKEALFKKEESQGE